MHCSSCRSSLGMLPTVSKIKASASGCWHAHTVVLLLVDLRGGSVAGWGGGEKGWGGKGCGGDRVCVEAAQAGGGRGLGGGRVVWPVFQGRAQVLFSCLTLLASDGVGLKTQAGPTCAAHLYERH